MVFAGIFVLLRFEAFKDDDVGMILVVFVSRFAFDGPNCCHDAEYLLIELEGRIGCVQIFVGYKIGMREEVRHQIGH